MKKWVVENFSTADGVPLDWELNNLEESGKNIKEIIFIGNIVGGEMYQIIYTEEDIMEVSE